VKSLQSDPTSPREEPERPGPDPARPDLPPGSGNRYSDRPPVRRGLAAHVRAPSDARGAPQEVFRRLTKQRLYGAFGAYAVLGLLAFESLEGPFRFGVWFLLLGLALKSWIAFVRSRKE
jgi:hypothetical protein